MINSSKAFHDAVIKQTLPESDEPDNDEGVNELNAEFIEADSDEESLNEQNSSDNGRATLLVCFIFINIMIIIFCLSLHNLIKTATKPQPSIV